MLKLLLFIALVCGCLWWFARGGGAPRPRDGTGSGAAKGAATEAMVRCEYCDTHVPQSSAVFAGKHGFCCEEHRAAAGY